MRPLAPAALPAEAWSLLRRLPEVDGARADLIARPGLTFGRSQRARQRREQLAALTNEALRMQLRLTALGIDPATLDTADALPVRQYKED